ncbi:MAG TPA: beta-propeller domain-containing protein, partial [Burkholderiales bacterium]|nr:beta-propeller domain-containing protein [Burkholderiales bacterium]
MKHRGWVVSATAMFVCIALAACISPTHSQATANGGTPRATLQAFNSEQEIRDLFKGWAEEQQRRTEAERKRRDEARAQMETQPGAGALQSYASPPAAAKAAAPASAAAESDAITNVQHTGVDEGGIVKLHGEHLVILRRGRLFTVKVRDRDLKPVSTVDAYGTSIDPRGAWYDEMLLSGNTIVVTGYSYQRGGTEIGLFEISANGSLKYRSTYHLRSNDYYSSRNYAGRLIGSKLIFYTPLRLNPFTDDPFPAFPAMRKWHSGATPAEFKRIAPAMRIYRTDEPLDPYQGITLHTVSVCDIAKPEFDCESTAVMGAPGRVFYVSSGSVYV